MWPETDGKGILNPQDAVVAAIVALMRW